MCIVFKISMSNAGTFGFFPLAISLKIVYDSIIRTIYRKSILRILRKEESTMNKRLFAALEASALLFCTACGNKTEESANENHTTAPPVTTAVTDTKPAEKPAETEVNEEVEFEEQITAESGDAFLNVSDLNWYVQYFGTKDDLLTYDAGIAHIDGDGDYTVSVNVGTKGAQFDITGEINGDYTCDGIDFAAVKVLDGATLFPDMCIEIKEIRVDGKAIEMTAQNYTSSDDGKEMRANIYNHFISNIPDDAHTPEGDISGEFGTYSSMIVDPDDFANWTSIEVDFTVTGTKDSVPANKADTTDAPAESTSSALTSVTTSE